MEKYYLGIGSFLVKDDNEYPPLLTDSYDEAKVYEGEEKRNDLKDSYGGNYIPIEEHKNRFVELKGMIKRTEENLEQLKKAKVRFMEEQNDLRK